MKSNQKSVIIWLTCVCVLIFCMVFVGGMTRLTDSGLSMVDWKPLMGIIPPLSDFEWLETFKKYQQFPEYKIINKGMTLSEFKGIFYWEYFHRLLGRLIGVVYFFPLVYFQITKKIQQKQLAKKLWVGLVLGGLQGLMGWYMVMSGLVDIPDVSHLRLAAHFMLALFIFCYLFWIILDLLEFKKHSQPAWYKLSLISFILVLLQITWGAFTAGLKAGFGYNTFPLMGTSFIPDGLTMLPTWFENIFDNPVSVQFVHRSIAWILFFMAAVLVFKTKKQPLVKRQELAVYAFSFSIIGQFFLGVLTLIYFVPIPLAILHQTGAFIVLAITVHMLHSFK